MMVQLLLSLQLKFEQNDPNLLILHQELNPGLVQNCPVPKVIEPA